MDSLLKNAGQKKVIAVLDGVRACACLIVIAYHINYLTLRAGIWTPASMGSMATSFALAGSSGVTLFFVLSGFLLFLSYARSLLFDAPWPSARRFYIRRAFRILPGYYASLALLILFGHTAYLQPAHWGELGLFLVLLMDANSRTFQAINGPFWTLAVEWQFYLLLPLLALVFRCWVQRGELQGRLYKLWVCLGMMAGWGILTRWWGRSWEINPTQPGIIPPAVHQIALFLFYGMNGKYLEDFAVGMFICSLYVLAFFQPEHRFISVLRRWSRWIWGGGLLWLCYTATWSVLPGGAFLEPLIGSHNWLSDLFIALGFGICVAALLFGPADLRRLLEGKFVRELGHLSYGMYIWHLPILLWLGNIVLPLFQSWGPGVIYTLYWLCVILLIIPFSFLFHRFIELPWIHIGSRLTSAKGME